MFHHFISFYLMNRQTTFLTIKHQFCSILLSTPSGWSFSFRTIFHNFRWITRSSYLCECDYIIWCCSNCRSIRCCICCIWCWCKGWSTTAITQKAWCVKQDQLPARPITCHYHLWKIFSTTVLGTKPTS